jgi:hypothetical protein
LYTHGFSHQFIEGVAQFFCHARSQWPCYAWSHMDSRYIKEPLQNLASPLKIQNWACRIPNTLSTSFIATAYALWKSSSFLTSGLTTGFTNVHHFV